MDVASSSSNKRKRVVKKTKKVVRKVVRAAATVEPLRQEPLPQEPLPEQPPQQAVVTRVIDPFVEELPPLDSVTPPGEPEVQRDTPNIVFHHMEPMEVSFLIE